MKLIYKIKKPVYLGILVFLLASPVFLPAMTADGMEVLLSEKAVTYGQAASFMLNASLGQSLTEEEAFKYAMDRKWLPKKVSQNDSAKLNGISHLIMQSFGIKGGLMYSLTKSPHYAYRDLVYRNIIQGRTDPRMDVSGETLLFIVSRYFTIMGDE